MMGEPVQRRGAHLKARPILERSRRTARPLRTRGRFSGWLEALCLALALVMVCHNSDAAAQPAENPHAPTPVLMRGAGEFGGESVSHRSPSGVKARTAPLNAIRESLGARADRITVEVSHPGRRWVTAQRTGCATVCPNPTPLLHKMIRPAPQIMPAMPSRGQAPGGSVSIWSQTALATLDQWRKGLGVLERQAALATVLAVPHPRATHKFQNWISSHRIPVEPVITRWIAFLKQHGHSFFNALATIVRGSVDGLNMALLATPAPLLIALIATLAWFMRRSVALVAFVVLALLLIINLGYWSDTLTTLSLVGVAATLSTAIGVPLGVLAAHRPTVKAALRPLLDLMQTLPAFVYLIPALVLFGLGVVPGLISTVIFALPAPIRLTELGISAVPKALLEAGEAFGATRLQRLWKVELPSAAPTIVAGITQCIMLSLSMVVIAALVGAGGLGVPVVRALNTVQIGMGFEAGLVIVLLAIILDRITTRPAGKERKG